MGGKILILDDVATNRIVLKVKLSAAGYHPLLAADGAAGLALARAETPDLILLDHCLPDMPGTAVLARLRADPLTRSTPVIMLSSNTTAAVRVAAFQAGADEFLTKPADDQMLLARIRSFMRLRELSDGLAAAPGGLAMLGLAEAAEGYQSPARIAVITAKPDLSLLLRRDLASHSPDRIFAITAEEALGEGMTHGPCPDVFVIESDLTSPGSGLRLMSELRSRAHTRHAAVAILVPNGSTTSPAVVFDLGAHDMLTQQMTAPELGLRIARLVAKKREGDRLRASVQDGLRLAMIDPLTGLHNRRYGVAQLAAIAERAMVQGDDFAVMVVDLDRFKQVNDRWGHAAGDAVLVEVAARLQRSLRNGDLLARIGGEEFLIALPETCLAEARAVAERLCRIVEEIPVLLACGGRLRVTVSIGLALSAHRPTAQRGTAVSDLVEQADRALMVSKSGGRNQVTISQTAA